MEIGVAHYFDQQSGEGSLAAKVVEVDIQGLRPPENSVNRLNYEMNDLLVASKGISEVHRYQVVEALVENGK